MSQQRRPRDGRRKLCGVHRTKENELRTEEGGGGSGGAGVIDLALRFALRAPQGFGPGKVNDEQTRDDEHSTEKGDISIEVKKRTF